MYAKDKSDGLSKVQLVIVHRNHNTISETLILSTVKLLLSEVK